MSALDVIFGQQVQLAFHTQVQRIRTALQRRRQYRRMVAELSSFTDRDLHDMGIRRDMIEGIAGRAALEWSQSGKAASDSPSCPFPVARQQRHAF